MNIDTGREFNFTNPQDDPDLYPTPPTGFSYDINGKLIVENIPKLDADGNFVLHPKK